MASAASIWSRTAIVGMKSRGMYETPGGTILLAAHRGIESITLDRGAAHLKDEIMPRYAEMIYNGFWFAPEREMLQALIDKSQEFVTGRVRLKLYKGRRGLSVGRAHIRSTIRIWSRSRTARSLTTSGTQAASSSSTPCVCARWPSARVVFPARFRDMLVLSPESGDGAT